MTREVRDNIDGLTYDEEETCVFTFTFRNHPEHPNMFLKVEGDCSIANFLELYGKMVKKPKYQRWIKATEEERAKDKNVKGHWEKL